MSLTCRCECINNLIISPFLFSEAMDILDEFNGEHGDGEGPKENYVPVQESINSKVSLLSYYCTSMIQTIRLVTVKIYISIFFLSFHFQKHSIIKSRGLQIFDWFFSKKEDIKVPFLNNRKVNEQIQICNLLRKYSRA